MAAITIALLSPVALMTAEEEAVSGLEAEATEPSVASFHCVVPETPLAEAVGTTATSLPESNDVDVQADAGIAEDAANLAEGGADSSADIGLGLGAVQGILGLGQSVAQGNGIVTQGTQLGLRSDCSQHRPCRGHRRWVR